jgi:hypothetical protein
MSTQIRDASGRLRQTTAGIDLNGKDRATNARVKSAATTNATLVKAGAAKIYGFAFYNTTSAAKYVKIYDKLTVPVVGTDVPVMTIQVPANAHVVLDNSFGIGVLLGLGLGITGAAVDTDTTAVAVGDVYGNVFFT